MSNDFKKGFFFGAGFLIAILLPTTIFYLPRLIKRDIPFRKCIKEVELTKEKSLKAIIDYDYTPERIKAYGTFSENFDKVFKLYKEMKQDCRVKYYDFFW